jgi:hypothetical protein
MAAAVRSDRANRKGDYEILLIRVTDSKGKVKGSSLTHQFPKGLFTLFADLGHFFEVKN